MFQLIVFVIEIIENEPDYYVAIHMQPKTGEFCQVFPPTYFKHLVRIPLYVLLVLSRDVLRLVTICI
jgi:hypothetical protein